jgi:hypothetical protein
VDRDLQAARSSLDSDVADMQRALNLALPWQRVHALVEEPRGRQRGQYFAFFADQPQVAGMRMQAGAMLGRRRLIEWLFAPLLGLTGRL